jgi:hypothetical protein
MNTQQVLEGATLWAAYSMHTDASVTALWRAWCDNHTDEQRAYVVVVGDRMLCVEC